MTQEAKQRALEKVLAGIAMIKEDHGDEHPSDYSFQVLGSMLFDHLETILECLSQPPEGWKPIETAPRDGSRIFLFPTKGSNQPHPARKSQRVTVGYWYQPSNPSAKGFWNTSNSCCPTHWMPLPAAPVIEEKVG